jgi:HK97 family phage major capsid protein
MTIEEILSALQAIIDQAVTPDSGEPRDLTEEEAARYETLEAQLAVARRSQEIRARQNAYQMPVAGIGVVSAARPDDGLERAFDSYLRTGTPNQDITQLRAQGEGISSAGGYLVPSGFRQKLVERMVAFGGFANEAEDFSTSDGRPLEYPTFDDTANSGTITAESGAFTGGADAAFGNVSLGAYKYTSAGAGDLPIRVPVELMQDNAFDLRGLLTKAMGTRIARKQTVDFVTGTGVGQPKGILCSTLTADRDLDTADTPDYEDLVEFQDLLDEAYEPNAKWLMRKSTWSQLRLIVDTIGRPILQTLTDGITGKPERRLLGAPVVIDQAVPVLSSAGDTFCLAYGDFRESYVIRRVANLVVMVDPYSRANYGEVQYTAWLRGDGNVQNRNAYVIMQNNT